ncbi:ATP synthase F1 subunit delta [Asaia krungthepensis NRIC 0535]|uniref:ATP synthase subunit delta n=2 Tax=Asaia krungthepensis TaxID=220990 RepID=A0ABQ0Q3K7_9PROT|nr:ATP synthase F1 subunit delta [Asaia krungthepensis NRIC 0535]
MTVVETAEAPQVSREVSGGMAQRYALALYDYADEKSVLPEVLDQVRALRKLIAESAPLREFLADQSLDSRQAGQGLEAVLNAQGFSETLKRFVAVIARNRRVARVDEILGAVLALDAKRRGETIAEVRSAQPLTAGQRSALQTRLAEAGYARVSMIERVEPELIGGLVVQIGAKLFDTSIRGRLTRIQNAMKGAA